MRLATIVLTGVLLIGGGTRAALHAQGLTGQISGSVGDSDGGVIPGVTVSVTNTGTNQVRDAITGEDGAFLFPDLLAGTYQLKVSLPGFKTYEQTGLRLGSTERLALPRITLAVGELNEQVTVEARSTLVQTTNAARSGVIEREKIDDIALKGRDFAGLLKTLPGVIDTSAREAPGWGSMGDLSINGRSGGFNFSYDGVTNKDTGSNSGNYAAPALDSIAEVRVQTSNFQAEYGRSSGATITVVTRSGSKDFRGSLAYYKRDDAFNANEFSRRQQCGLGQTAQCDPPEYKFDNTAWTLGGPVLMPGTRFNRGRNKLFFFWSQDLLARTDPGTLNRLQMPTARERQGDFSQTLDSQGRLIRLRDPLLAGACNSVTGGPGCFAGNVIPANRIDPVGQALLNLFPLPNADDPTGARQYNYAFQSVQDMPRNDQVLRLDWNVASRTTFYSRVQFGYEKRAGASSFLGATNGWPQYPTKYDIETFGIVNTLLHTFTPTTFVELTVGMNRGAQDTGPLNQTARDANDRSIVLPGFPQFFPGANPLNVLPQATFAGGVPGTAGQFGVESRFPFQGVNTLWNVSGNLTKVKGAHNMKAGLFLEHTTRAANRASSFNGTISFNTDASNPLNTNVGFSNALLGAVTSYTESTVHPRAVVDFINLEWYLQDNWRVARRFTVDAGIRFYYITPARSTGGELSMFVPQDWSAPLAPQLIEPVLTADGRRGRNPVTGEILPLVYIGRLVPGSGDPYNGMQLFDRAVQDTPPIQVAPRLGFAWDVAGDGNTSIRGGAGVFYDRYGDGEVLQFSELPPLVDTYTTNYSTLSGLLASPLTATPTAVRNFATFEPPVVYNWSVGLQRALGLGLVGDIAYVGNAGRNQLVNRQINGQPYGYSYLPSSLDPTNVVGGQAQPLPANFLRPYPGFASIIQREFSGFSAYHSLQLSANRRRSADGLSFGASYTYEMVNNLLDVIDPFVSDNRARNYTSVGRRPHNLVVNYSYEIPDGVWTSKVARAALANWQVSGITQIVSGSRQGFSYAYVNVPAGALSGTGGVDTGASRVDIVCDPNLARGERTFDRQFRTECLAAPSDPLRLGNALGDEYQGPGFMNFDFSVFKNVPLSGNRRFQLRLELYNAFNADQWTATDTSATFDYQTGAQTDANFGRLTGATQSARRIQLGARFTF